MKLKSLALAASIAFSASALASDIQQMPTLFDCKMSKDVGSILFGSWGSGSYDYIKMYIKQEPITNYSTPPKIAIGAYAIKKLADGSEKNIYWKRLDRVTGAKQDTTYAFAYSRGVTNTMADPFLAVISESGQATIQNIGNVTYGWKYSHPQAFFCNKKNELKIATAFDPTGMSEAELMQAMDNLNYYGAGTRRYYGGYYGNIASANIDPVFLASLEKQVSDHIEKSNQVLVDEDGQMLLFGQSQPCGGTKLESVSVLYDYLGNKVGSKGKFVCQTEFKTEATTWGRDYKYFKQMEVYFTDNGILKTSLEKGQITEKRDY